MRLTRTVAALTAAAFVSGCATQAANVTAAYVPKSRYNAAACAQLQEDLAEATARESALTAKQDGAASKDAALVAVSLILFWPAAFFVGQDKGNEAELARVKGERQAIEAALRDKRCGA